MFNKILNQRLTFLAYALMVTAGNDTAKRLSHRYISSLFCDMGSCEVSLRSPKNGKQVKNINSYFSYMSTLGYRYVSVRYSNMKFRGRFFRVTDSQYRFTIEADQEFFACKAETGRKPWLYKDVTRKEFVFVLTLRKAVIDETGKYLANIRIGKINMFSGAYLYQKNEIRNGI